MKRSKAGLFLAPGLLALAGLARGSIADTNSNPYQIIAERNAFALKPPPPPPAPATNKPPEVHNVKFTGLSRDATGKKAYLMEEDPVKPGQQPVRQYLCLAEGERQGDIEVKEINETAETVTILNGSDLVTLNFKEHGNTASPQPGQPIAPGLPGRPGVPLPGVPPAPGIPTATPTLAGYNAAIMNAQTPVASLSEAVNSATGGNTQNNASRMIPSRSLRTQPNYFNYQPTPGQPAPQVPAPPPIDPNAQKALMLINSQLNSGESFPPLPPLE